jgi:single-strand DNA-binding protein
MINKVILIGNLGQDPELRTTAGGTHVASLSVATTDRRKDRDGNWGEHTEWHKVVVFGKTAENVAQYLKKGRQVYVEGRLSTQKWQDKNGVDRWTTEIIGENVRFLGTGQGARRDSPPEGGGFGGDRGGHAPESQANGAGDDAPPFDDIDVPF